MGSVHRKPQLIDCNAVRECFLELSGIAALLIDAQRYGDVSPEGIYAAARFIETIQDRLKDEIDVEGDLP